MSSTDYFDSSALVKWYLAETGSTWVQARCNNPTQVIVTADLARAEMAAAFARKLREGTLTPGEYQNVRGRLTIDAQKRYQIVPIVADRVDEAIELTSRNQLRGYDAVHLACALHVNQALLANHLPPLTLIAADDDLLKAAQAEGLRTENPNLHP
jgi:predicted nucleic acid-binding protein